MDELVGGEDDYLIKLEYLNEKWEKVISMNILKKDDLEILFKNIRNIYIFHKNI